MKKFLYLLIFFFSLKGEFSFSSYFKNSDPESSLLRSAASGCVESLELSLGALSSCSEKKKLMGEALIWAAKNKRVEILKLLLENKAQINFRGSKEETALHWVADSSIKGNEKCYDLLVSYGADPEVQDHQGFSPGYLRRRFSPRKKMFCSRVLSGVKKCLGLKSQ